MAEALMWPLSSVPSPS